MTTPPLTNWPPNDQHSHGQTAHGMYPPSGLAIWRHLQASSQEGLMAHRPQLVQNLIGLQIVIVYMFWKCWRSIYHDISCHVISTPVLPPWSAKGHWIRKVTQKAFFLVSEYLLSWHPGNPLLIELLWLFDSLTIECRPPPQHENPLLGCLGCLGCVGPRLGLRSNRRGTCLDRFCGDGLIIRAPRQLHLQFTCPSVCIVAIACQWPAGANNHS